MSVDNSADLFKAVVSEVSGEDVLFGRADGEGPLFPPREGAFVRLMDAGGAGRAFSQDAQVVERGGSALRRRLLGAPGRYERRSYKRAAAVLPLRFTVLSPPQSRPVDVMQRLDRLEMPVMRISAHLGLKDAGPDRPVALGEVCELSLSGGGVGLVLDYFMTVGERLDLELELPLHRPIQLRTKVEIVRCAPGLSADGAPSWVAGGRFHVISTHDRAAIVRYSAQREREVARTGAPLSA